MEEKKTYPMSTSPVLAFEKKEVDKKINSGQLTPRSQKPRWWLRFVVLGTNMSIIRDNARLNSFHFTILKMHSVLW